MSGWWASVCKSIARVLRWRGNMSTEVRIRFGARGQREAALFQPDSSAAIPPPLRHPTMPRLMALWSSFLRFLENIFRPKPALPTVAACPPTPMRALSPASPLPNISLSGIFATPPDVELALGPPELSPGSPPSLHTRHSRSPRTPSPLILRLDRSPTTMSDGSLEVISLGSPADIARLPSPWSPVGKLAASDVWMSVDGMLVNATGPLDSPDVSAASRTAMLSLSTTSLYSSPSALDAFGISVFDGPKLNQVRDEIRPTLVTHTPRKRRDTLPSVNSHALSHSVRATKHFSTPLTKVDNVVDVTHVRSATSVSSMAYELRMGLFAGGGSMTAFGNILSLLDQASPESKPPMQVDSQ